MRLSTLLKNVNYSNENYLDADIKSLSFNANEDNKEGLFFCLKGSKFDGHNFVNTAEKNGAVTIVCEKKVDSLLPQIIVPSSRKALSLIAGNFYDNPIKKMKLITITGTNGKTTTSYITKKILETAGYKVGLIGTNGNFIGDRFCGGTLTTPDPIELHSLFNDMKNSGVQFVVMEASAHAIFLNKLYGVKADLGILTNVTEDHLDFFKTMENYSAVKEGYFNENNVKKALVNMDDMVGGRILHKNKTGNILAYGLGNPNYARATIKNSDVNGSYFDLDFFEEDRLSAFIKIPGEFNVYNALAASSACKYFGVDSKTILKGLDDFSSVPGRFNTYKSKKGFSVIIDYAHTPDGLENILKAAKGLTDNKLICVFGCGGNRDAIKRPIMGKISTDLADFSFITSDNPRFENPFKIIGDIRKGVSKNKNYKIIENRAMAIKEAIKKAQSGDIVVIAGKGAETYQEIKGVKNYFNDEAEVLKCLNEQETFSIN